MAKHIKHFKHYWLVIYIFKTVQFTRPFVDWQLELRVSNPHGPLYIPCTNLLFQVHLAEVSVAAMLSAVD